MHKKYNWDKKMKVKIYIDWAEDDDGLQVERAVEITEEVLKKGYPVDVLIEQY